MAETKTDRGAAVPGGRQAQLEAALVSLRWETHLCGACGHRYRVCRSCREGVPVGKGSGEEQCGGHPQTPCAASCIVAAALAALSSSLAPGITEQVQALPQNDYAKRELLRTTESYYDPVPPMDHPRRHAYTLEMAQLKESRDQWKREAEDLRSERDALIASASSLAPGIPVEQALRAVFTSEVIRAIGALARQQEVCREQGGKVVFVAGMTAAREYIVEQAMSGLDALIASASAQGAASAAQDEPSDFDALLEHHRATERENESLRQKLAASVSPPAPQWRPIESAPKDGTDIIIAAHWKGERWLQGIGRWDNGRYSENKAGWGWTWYATPTHWMPLPDPPPSSSPTASAKGK